MSWSHLNHAHEPTVWSRREASLPFGIPTSRASEEVMIQDLEQSSLPLSSYTVQYPNYLAPSMVHPNMGGERHARKPSLSFSFGDESFDGSINSPMSSRDMVSESLYFSPAVSPVEVFSQDDSAISIHREWGLPSPTTSKTSMASNPFDSIQHGAPKPSVEKPSPVNSVATNPSKKSVRARKKNHNEIERCYRNRLNDKIECLAQYLFTPGASESQSGRARPPKCLVISRATERLKELEHRNLTLESENEALKRQVAVMDHLFAASSNGSAPPS